VDSEEFILIVKELQHKLDDERDEIIMKYRQWPVAWNLWLKRNNIYIYIYIYIYILLVGCHSSSIVICKECCGSIGDFKKRKPTL